MGDWFWVVCRIQEECVHKLVCMYCMSIHLSPLQGWLSQASQSLVQAFGGWLTPLRGQLRHLKANYSLQEADPVLWVAGTGLSQTIPGLYETSCCLCLSEARVPMTISCFWGSGSDGGRCPVEHRGEIPSIRPSIHLSVRSLLRLAQAAHRQDQTGWFWLAQATQRLAQASQRLFRS